MTENDDHKKQQYIWDREHQNPHVLKQMDSREMSGGVERFWDFLVSCDASRARGVEMGCGKGRNVIGLAKRGAETMYGFDFSSHAVAEANKRAMEAGVAECALFVEHDATILWPYDSDSMDFVIDCFASTDIESPEGRGFAVGEMRRVLKPGGYLMSYLLTPDDEFHKEMLERSPAHEKNAFMHDTGKFEKTFDKAEIEELFRDFKFAQQERVEKTTEFFGKQYACKHFWCVYQK